MDPEDHTAYLGKSLCLTNVHDAELKHRVACGWAKFMSYKRELCDMQYLLSQGSVFDLVVTSTVPYACGPWKMIEHVLTAAPRKMLRLMFGTLEGGGDKTRTLNGDKEVLR